jgi:hypothetical protein
MMRATTERLLGTAVAALAVATVAACGESDDGPWGAAEARSQPSAESRVQTEALNVSPGSRATLMRFDHVGRLEVSCRERPRVAFRVGLMTAAVGVDSGRGARVQTLDPGERLRTRLSSAGLQRWHVASSHGDGVRVVTASVSVTPVVGGEGACLFSAQSTRSGRIP